MHVTEIIEICKAWNDLGWAVQEQLNAVMFDGDNPADKNHNAMRYALTFLKQLNDVDGCQEIIDRISEAIAKDG